MAGVPGKPLIVASPQRVAHRYLLGGILQAPPAMVDDIYQWVVGILAATDMEKLQEGLVEARQRDANWAERYRKMEAILDAWEAAPTSWEAHKAFIEEHFTLGSPGTRWNAKDFQKLTPERREALVQRVQATITRARELLTARQGERSSVSAVEEEIARVQKLVRPGAKPMKGDEVVRVFPLDLVGWRYWTPEMQKRFEERARAEAQKLLDTIEEAHGKGTMPPDFYETMTTELRKRIEDPRSEWDSIKVKLIRKGTNFLGVWEPARHTLSLVAPYGTYGHLLDQLHDTVRHELQHFAQSYLAHMVDAMFKEWKPGLPTKLLRTLDYQQQYGPKHPSFDPNSPAMRKVYQKLKGQGIDPRGVDFHSLDDVEFYTRLADAVAGFKRAWSRAPRGDIKTAIRLYTGATPMPSSHDRDWYEKVQALGGYDFTQWFEPDRFFLALHKRALPKWKKAVAEFVKAVT